MCDIDAADGDWEEVSRATPIADAPHECVECGRVIAVGEFYEHEVARSDGELEVYTTCRHCLSAREWLNKNCGGFLYHGVELDLEAHVDEMVTPSSWLESALEGIRTRWVGREPMSVAPLEEVYHG